MLGEGVAFREAPRDGVRDGELVNERRRTSAGSRPAAVRPSYSAYIGTPAYGAARLSRSIARHSSTSSAARASGSLRESAASDKTSVLPSKWLRVSFSRWTLGSSVDARRPSRALAAARSRGVHGGGAATSIVAPSKLAIVSLRAWPRVNAPHWTRGSKDDDRLCRKVGEVVSSSHAPASMAAP